MTNKLGYKFLVHDKDRYGKDRIYIRIRRRKTRVPYAIGTPEFDAFYKNVVAGIAVAPSRPAARKRRLKGAYIYIIGSNGGSNKIGISATPEQRLAQLQVGNSSILELRRLFFVENIEAAREIEQYIHKFFSVRQRQGEWFRVSASVIAKEILRCSGVLHEVSVARKGNKGVQPRKRLDPKSKIAA